MTQIDKKFESLRDASKWVKRSKIKGNVEVLIRNPLKSGWADPYDKRILMEDN